MKIIFNDASELSVQSVKEFAGQLQILAINITPADLYSIFSDTVKTKVLRVEERGQIVAEYEGYTQYHHSEIHPGKIYGIVISQVGKSTEDRLQAAEQANEQTSEELKSVNIQITDLQMALCEIYEGMVI